MKLFSQEQLRTMLDMQQELDVYIRENNDIPHEQNLNEEKYIALKTELFEMVNEIESFKYWKKNRGKDNVLEEACDMLHFILSLAIDNDADLSPNTDDIKDLEDMDLDQYELNELITYVDDIIVGCYFMPNWNGLSMVLTFLSVIISKCGFSVDDLFKAYIEKNKVNMERQANNY